jgi:hypothetical protein
VQQPAGHCYTFPDGFRLGAGKQAIIHTGDGTSYTTSSSTHLYWGREWYVWNDTGDKVILRRADGSLKTPVPTAVPGARSSAKASRTALWKLPVAAISSRAR